MDKEIQDKFDKLEKDFVKEKKDRNIESYTTVFLFLFITIIFVWSIVEIV